MSASKSNSHKKPHLISNLHLADSLKISFTKLARAVFRNPIYELWLEKLKEFLLFKKTHREKAPKIKLRRLIMDIWVVGTSNQLFLRGSKTETNFPKKIK